jgi:CYTH domain-containing protein
MATEIEYKFRVTGDVPELGVGRTLEQWYIGLSPVVRVRIIEGTKAYLTIKGKGMVSRAEFEYEVPVADAEGMRELAKSNVVSKTRYRVVVGQHTWEVDQFHGVLEGLWLAEIELGSEDEAFEMPSWVGENVSRDMRYTNADLSEHGMPVDV